MKIYLMIQIDRHYGEVVMPYKDQGKALAEAECQARETAEHYHVPYSGKMIEGNPRPGDDRIYFMNIEDIGGIRVEEKELIE